MANRPVLQIAVDGFAASGKGTLARALARHYGLHYLDTGKLYRAVAWQWLSAGSPTNVSWNVFVEGIALKQLDNPALNSEEIGETASKLAALRPLRTALLAWQRQIGTAPHGAVLDGRDIGTVILPDAPYKFFVTATLTVRAARRHAELIAAGKPMPLAEVEAALAARDERDQNRKEAPLLQAKDAIVIDTTHLNPEETVAAAVTHIL
jgi:cytidylate kinase